MSCHRPKYLAHTDWIIRDREEKILKVALRAERDDPLISWETMVERGTNSLKDSCALTVLVSTIQLHSCSINRVRNKYLCISLVNRSTQTRLRAPKSLWWEFSRWVLASEGEKTDFTHKNIRCIRDAFTDRSQRVSQANWTHLDDYRSPNSPLRWRDSNPCFSLEFFNDARA